MKIGHIRINGIQNPIGYVLDSIRVSWLVTETAAKAAERARVEVSTDPDFSTVQWSEEGALDSACTPLEIDLQPRTRYYVRVSVTADSGETAVSDGKDYFETGKLDEPWTAKWIKPAPEDAAKPDAPEGRARKVFEEFHPVFEKRFTAKENLTSARLYISGLGLYVASLNGEEVGEERLTPYFSDYRSEVQYQSYDVTERIGADNLLTVALGNGWYKGVFGLDGKRANYGSEFQMIAEVHLTYADGSAEIVASDESWEYRGGDTSFSDIYDGEVLDRLRWADVENPLRKSVPGGIGGKLTARRSVPVREMETLPVKAVLHTPAGETVLDFGQNFAGYVSIRSQQPRGTRIILDFGEILQDGNFYNANYRSAISQFTYISDGRREWVRPRFTFFGFRYVRVTGWAGALIPEDFAGVALYSEMERSGTIETGHAKLNRLFQNALWGQKSNSIDIATDCPQRDERLGWTGDAQVFSGTGCYNMDAAAFYNKFCHDLHVEQQKLHGLLPGVIPVLNPGSVAFAAVWGDIATMLPSLLYERYGDLPALETAYPMMKSWVDYIDAEDAKRGHNYLFNFSDQMGDWLALDGRTEQSMEGGTDEYFIGSCYYAMSAALVSRAAHTLGRKEDADVYHALHEKIVRAVLDNYYTATGRLAVDTQTGYIVALYTGVYPDKKAVIDGLNRRLYRDCYQIKGGFVGAPILCKVLAEYGLTEEAYSFLLNEDYPGWLHCIDLGATTIWERWNSVLDDGHLSGTTMNSLNHYAFGAVIEFLYAYAAGIRPAAPGFRKAVIAPLPDLRLGWLKASYRSAHGLYRSEWAIEADGMLQVTVEIPFGCTAEVKLPFYDGIEAVTLHAGVYTYRYRPTKNLLRKYSEKTLIGDMLRDAKTAELIRSVSPLLAWYLDTGNADYLYENMDTLRQKAYMGFSKEEVDKLQAAILNVT